MKSKKTLPINAEKYSCAKEILCGIFSGALVCTMILYLFAFCFVKMGSIPYAALSIIAVFAASTGAFCSGFICIKIRKKQGLLYGGICGIVLFLLITLASFIYTRESFSFYSIIKLLFMALFGAIGGVLAVNRIKK